MFCDIKNQLDHLSVLQIMAYSEYEESLERAVKRAQAHRENDAQYVYGWIERDFVLGVCAFQIQPDKVIINAIAVAKHSRKRGVGSAMVTALRGKYKKAIEAETDDDAVEFYRKCGFLVSALPKVYDNCRWSCVLPVQEQMKNDPIDRIIPLEREKWQGYILPFHYVSHNFYDVEIARADDNFQVSFVKKPFDIPFEYKPEKDYDKLFQSHWDDVKAWGIVENERLIAAIETAVEEWSNRLRVTELWMDDAFRRQGIGTALMNIAMKRARDEKRRAITLETQSRNENAIAFYLAYGFTLIGFNACEYQNNDLQRKEVRMEMGILLSYDE